MLRMGYLVVTSMIWALSFPLIGGQLAGVDSVLVAAIRLGLSLLVFLPFLRPLPVRQALTWMMLGALQFGAMYCLYIASYGYLAAHQVALLTITTPLFVVLWDSLWCLRWRGRDWLAAMVAVLAALVLTVGGFDGAAAPLGVVLIQAANLCFAAGQVWYKQRLAGQTSGMGWHLDAHAFGWLYLGAVLVPCSLLWWRGVGTWPDQASQWWSLLYLGLLPSGLGFFLWNRGVRLVGPGLAAAMNNLKVPLGVLAAWLILAEPVTWSRLIPAAILFVLALILAKKSRKPAADQARPSHA